MVWNIDEAEDQPLSLTKSRAAPHDRMSEYSSYTAAPDDMNRMTVLHNGNVVQLSPITRIQLSLDCLWCLVLLEMCQEILHTLW